MLPFFPLLRRIRHGLTLGVRVLAVDGDDRLLLVRHTYTPGWHLPGGGVDLGESASAAARRELKEEADTEPVGALELHGIFFNPRVGGRDHVVCFHTRVAGGPPPAPGLEIREVGYFPLSRLPREVTGGTLRRIAEWRGGMPLSAEW
ncbi:NUDIX domain-containing protein [Xanthobacter sp. V4C-4]|uniref:NUDIX domain-containing protein n=1 Tax=Xanthobacter cornucopiae TaxID=3119924 RepID=UPI00372666B9